jgi:ankyrin repeat protein
MCEMLIESGADVNQPQSRSGEYPIHFAASSGDLHKIWLIRNHGADVSAKDDDGRTALFPAATSGASDVISVLASWGLDVNSKDKEGNTPLLSVVAFMQHLRQLVQDYNSTQSDDSDQILDVDEEVQERLDAIRTLVAWGADINAMNDAGECALSLAEPANETSLTEVLVELGAVWPAASEKAQAK